MKPWARVNQLTPPPSSRPTTLGSGLLPQRAIRPVSSSSRISSPHFTPAPTTAERSSTSTAMPRRARVRSSRVSSSVVRGAWPDGWAVTEMPDSIAQRTAVTTSATFATSRTAAGCWSTLTTQGVRACCQSASAGVTRRPSTAERRESQSRLPTGVAVRVEVVIGVVLLRGSRVVGLHRGRTHLSPPFGRLTRTAYAAPTRTQGRSRRLLVPSSCRPTGRQDLTGGHPRCTARRHAPPGRSAPRSCGR